MAYSNQLTNYGSFKYVVTGTEPGPFHTIQAALNQANTDSATTTILIRPGTYTENLTLYSGINIQGSEEGQVVIIGTHTPPAAGSFAISQCTLQSATDVFNSAAAGTANITVENCTFTITAGYVFNLLNWLSDLRLDNCLDISTTNNILNNTAGSFLEILNSTVGTAGGAGMVSSGVLRIVNSRIFCAMAVADDATIESSTVGATVTIAGAGDITVNNSYIDTAAAASIITTTTGQLTISDSTISSSAVNVITGTSDVELASVTFLDGFGTAGVTIKTDSQFRCNQAHATEAMTIDAGNFNLTNGQLNINGSTGTNGQVIIAATGANPAWASLTSTGGSIAFTAGANTLNLEVTGGADWHEATASMNLVAGNGYITKIAVPGLLTYTLPATAAQGSIIEITGYTAGGWSIAQNAGQSIHYAGSTTTPGVGGSLASTQRYDSVRLVCVTADTEWNVIASIGNLTIV